MIIVGNQGLLAHAKVLEYGTQNFVGGDGTSGDLGEMEEALAKVLRNKVAGEVGGEAVAHAVEVGEGFSEGGVMAGVGHHYGTSIGGAGGRHLDKQGCEALDVGRSVGAACQGVEVGRSGLIR